MGLTSDHDIDAGADCFVHSALLFSVTVIHGTVPDELVLCQFPKGIRLMSQIVLNFGASPKI